MPVTIPDSVLAAAKLTEAELRRELAVALFREERLTLGQACRLADMDQFAFQSILADREIPVHYGNTAVPRQLSEPSCLLKHGKPPKRESGPATAGS